MTRDRVENAFRRAHSAELHNTSIDVFEPTEEYVQGDGWSVTYPDEPSATYEARVDSPSADADRTRSGTSTEIDVVVRVRDDTGQEWTGYGENTSAALRIRDTADGTMYEVQTVVDAHNGLVELEAVEL